jgi:hypothetical protein
MTENELKEKIKYKNYKMSKSMKKMIERMNITKKKVETKNPIFLSRLNKVVRTRFELVSFN